ncbi:hypothetical protein [Actinosynnema sp.]|uniref:hypothetical protein n=1 Tax=Actinosynnema sp. TaxID=1872144 RepID=UPI003F85C725
MEAVYEDIDTLLSATFGVDDYVDLEELRVTAVEHPPFEAGSLAQPSAPVPPLQLPPAPAPPAPQRKGLLTSAKKHDERAAAAQTRHQEEVARWQAHNDNMRRSHADAVEARERAEQDRLAALAAAQRAYEDACRQREAEAAAQNAELDRFINELAFDVEAAIQEYVGIVLSNSAYPDTFPVQHSHSFDISTRELTLEVSVPEPGTVPTTKAFRYVKAKNEVTETALPQKEQKERYANAVWQVGLRTLHEVFEADRAGRIHSIALTVGTRAVVPATGREEFIPLLVVGAERETFTTFDLSNVVPAATLEHMGAAMSKSPRDLVPADTTRGVRRRSS